MTGKQVVALTGGSGFIGSAVRSVLADEFDFVVIGRSPIDVDLPGDADHVVSDYSADSLRNVFNKCVAVVHLASQKVSPQSEGAGLQGYTPSLQALENVFSAAHDCGIDNVVSLSSRCVYGLHSNTPFLENDTLEPINYYGVYKLAAEHVAGLFNRQKSMSIKTLRLSQVVGDDSHGKNIFSSFHDLAKANKPITLIGSDVRDYIYVDDVAEAIRHAIRVKENRGVYNVGSGVGSTNLEVAQAAIDALQSSSPIRRGGDSETKKATRIILNCNRAATELGWRCANPTTRGIMQLLAEKRRSE